MSTSTTPPIPAMPSGSVGIHVYQAKDFHNDAALAQTLTAFINEGYKYANPDVIQKWDIHHGDRLSTPTRLYETLGSDGLLAVAYDANMPVACTGTHRWEGDMNGFAEEGELENGWEFTMVTTKQGWMKQGLQGRCVAALTDELVRQERDRKKDAESGKRKVRLWVHCVEELNGAYWRRRGWVEVRRFGRPAGKWGASQDFELVVMLKEVDIEDDT